MIRIIHFFKIDIAVANTNNYDMVIFLFIIQWLY